MLFNHCFHIQEKCMYCNAEKATMTSLKDSDSSTTNTKSSVCIP